jgi:hypothetical protein
MMINIIVMATEKEVLGLKPNGFLYFKNRFENMKILPNFVH